MSPHEAFVNWLLPYAAIGFGLLLTVAVAVGIVAVTSTKNRGD